MPEWIGKTIGKVRIEKLLARGGMAEVYLGTHITLGRPVGVKLLHQYIEEDPLLLERFQREAKVVAGFRHPNIVQIFDFDTIDGHPYIVMEYLKGPTLATYLRYLHQRKKRLPHAQVARLLNGLASALDYAHTLGVIHRDIKPGNILLHNEGDEIPLDQNLSDDVEAVLTDFGLVRLVNTATHTTSGLISGTPAYMSPEQALGTQIDRRTDIYSLGIVLYEMLAGQLPFKADNTLTVLHMQLYAPPLPIPELPAKVQAVLNRALQKDPKDRYQTSRELAMDYSRSIGLIAEEVKVQEPEPIPLAPAPPPIQTPAASQPKVSRPKVSKPKAPKTKPVYLPADLLELLAHENSSFRKMAVQELVSLLDSRRSGLAHAAQEKLREIAETDDSLTLRKIAAQELNARGLKVELPVTPASVEIQQEKLAIPPPPPEENISSPENERRKLSPLPRLNKRLVGGILGIAVGMVVLVGAGILISGGGSILGSAATATKTPTVMTTSMPVAAVTATPTLSVAATNSPLPTFTKKPTSTVTLTATPTPTRTLIPPTATKKKRDNSPGEPPIGID